MPSAEAISPAPQSWTSGNAACADTIRALAAAMVSGRIKFWLIQPRRSPPEGRHIGSADRLGADIACLRHQRGAQTDFKMLHPGLPFAEMREGSGEAGALHDFEEQIGHTSPWHSSLNLWTQQAQAFRVFEPIEGCDHNACLPVHRLESKVWIACSPLSDSAVGAIEQFCEAIDFGFSIQRAV